MKKNSTASPQLRLQVTKATGLGTLEDHKIETEIVVWYGSVFVVGPGILAKLVCEAVGGDPAPKVCPLYMGLSQLALRAWTAIDDAGVPTKSYVLFKVHRSRINTGSEPSAMQQSV